MDADSLDTFNSEKRVYTFYVSSLIRICQKEKIANKIAGLNQALGAKYTIRDLYVTTSNSFAGI